MVIGSGPELKRIQQLARPNVQILGAQPDAVVEQYMASARAFVYAACEDFGIAPVEAQACGTPVIAYGAGGVLETVRDVRQAPTTGTGVFFPTQTEPDLIEAVQWFESQHHCFQPEILQQQAARFSTSVFARSYLAYLDSCYGKFSARQQR